MTISKTIQLQRHGLTPIDVEPVWENGKIQLFDMYNKGHWIGSLRLLSYCEHKVSQSQHENDWIFTWKELEDSGFKLVQYDRFKWFEDNGIKILSNKLIRGQNARIRR